MAPTRTGPRTGWALLAFADEVGATGLAEGVGTDEQLRTLPGLGVPLGQDGHLGVPTAVT